MTIRTYVKCTICDFNMMLKIGEGGETYQPHIFDCPNCYSPITIALTKVKDKQGFGFETVSNCKSPTFEEVNVLNSLPNDQPNNYIICLHSNFAFDINSFHDPMGTMFVKIKGMQKLTPLVKERWGFFNEKLEDSSSDPMMIDIAHFFDVPDCEKIWTTILKPYYIGTKKNNIQQIDVLKKRYIKERKKYVPKVNVRSHYDLFFDFFSSMFYPRFNEIYRIINNAVVLAKKTNTTEYEKFIKFYKTERWKNSQEQQIQLFSEYFSYTTEFAQMRYYARANESNVENLLVGSKNFEKTKLFYGNAYEVITNEYIFLAGIFNIINGRNFDQFRTMTLQQYIKDCSKDSRKAPLQTYQSFNNFLDEIDSTLRNGTHHASIHREHEILYYRSGGTGAEREIEYSKYLYLCNRLMILSTALFCLEYKWLNTTN